MNPARYIFSVILCVILAIVINIVCMYDYADSSYRYVQVIVREKNLNGRVSEYDILMECHIKPDRHVCFCFNDDKMNFPPNHKNDYLNGTTFQTKYLLTKRRMIEPKNSTNITFNNFINAQNDSLNNNTENDYISSNNRSKDCSGESNCGQENNQNTNDQDDNYEQFPVINCNTERLDELEIKYEFLKNVYKKLKNKTYICQKCEKEVEKMELLILECRKGKWDGNPIIAEYRKRNNFGYGGWTILDSCNLECTCPKD